MSEPDHTDGMPPEDGCALLAEAERRFEAPLEMLPPELREEIDQGRISRHEASTFVLDCLLIDAAVWKDAEKLLAQPKTRRPPKLTGKTENARKLAAEFNLFAEAAPNASKSIGSLVRNFRKTLGSEFGWLRGTSHERVEALIREGRRLLVSRSHVANAKTWSSRRPQVTRQHDRRRMVCALSAGEQDSVAQVERGEGRKDCARTSSAEKESPLAYRPCT
jgi:hypothetical protein